MATPWKIHIDPSNTGLWKVNQTEDAATKASELLQQDLDTHHVFFNDQGFHNHIVHHTLSLYGTGAPARILQAGYDANASYQRPALPVSQQAIQDFQSWEHAETHLGKEKHYPDFLAFFQREMAAKGSDAVLNEYLFSGTAAADDLLVRWFAGALHPLIQTMFAMEWKQPAIVAEALAQTCVHQPQYKTALLRAEATARGGPYGETCEDKPRPRRSVPRIMELLKMARDHEKIRTAVRPEDAAPVAALFKRAPEELVEIISQVKVWPEELEEKTAEMFDASLFTAAAASFHPGKTNKFDFFLIHHINAAPMFLTINEQPWIPVKTKARLLEWKIRYDIIQYAGRAVPALPLDQLKAYQPTTAAQDSITGELQPSIWSDQQRNIEISPATMSRLHDFAPNDDGHAIKLSRAAAITQAMSKNYEDKDWMMIKGDDMWTRIHHLIADSVQAPGPTWVRTAGLDEAWSDIPARSKL